MWNYRGYGMSTGTPSIRKSQKDALEVYKHFTKLGYRIVHVQGTSIGGVAAVGLAYQLQLQNDTTIESIIIDRSFSSIGKVDS